MYCHFSTLIGPPKRSDVGPETHYPQNEHCALHLEVVLSLETVFHEFTGDILGVKNHPLPPQLPASQNRPSLARMFASWIGAGQTAQTWEGTESTIGLLVGIHAAVVRTMSLSQSARH